MQVKLIGAAGGEVTGSAYVVRTKKASILIDAGMFQGGKQSEAKNRLPPGAKAHQIEAVLLTHAHLDHTGRLPLLIRHGYRGPVYATAATIDLAELILRDSARIQQYDAERQQRRASRRSGGRKEQVIAPLYDLDDVEPLRAMTRSVAFQKPVQVAEGITARWIEAGHMLGSGSIELTVEEDGRQKIVVFSGDLGPTTLPLIREFETFQRADAVFLESTYGNRLHRPYAETIAEFERIVKLAIQSSGKILIPTFAIGRSQQILYHLAIMFLRNDVPGFPVFLDSPMAIEASKIYVKHPDLYDEELLAWKKQGLLPLNKKFFRPSVTAADSKALNAHPGPCAILAGAGMCNAGRILHHLRQHLSNHKTQVLIVGYQGHGSLGRRLVEKQKVVTIFGERIPVNATIHTLNGFSGHADQNELLQWYSSLAPGRPKTILTHGEDPAREVLGKMIQQKFKITPALPKQGEVIEI